jgi:radical SAM protein with 4Fe4S-binding SPASM domain
MNFLLTSNCNNNCKFCFMSEHFKNSKEEMSFDKFKYLLDHSIYCLGIKSASILGGEPTQAKDFNDIIKYSIDKLESVSVFSNLICDKSKLIDIVQDKNITVIWNSSTLFTTSIENKEIMLSNLEYLLENNYPYKISNAITVCRNTTYKDYSYVIDLYKKYGIYNLRFAINSLDSDYFMDTNNAQTLFDIIKYLVDNGISLSQDSCGHLLLCMFNDRQYHFLVDRVSSFNSSYCGGNSMALDVLPNGSVIPCMPYSYKDSNVYLNRFNSFDNLIEAVKKEYGLNTYIHPCDDKKCDKKDRCGGPCYYQYSYLKNKDKENYTMVVE